MSNLIKYYTFNVTEDDKRLLDSDQRVGGFVPGILSHGQIEVSDEELDEFDREFPEQMFEEQEEEEPEITDPEQLLAMAHEEAGEILERAEKEAEKILDLAKISAEYERDRIYESAKETGYRDGLVKANDEMTAERQKLKDKTEELEREYEDLVNELEPSFVKLVMGIVNKMTGVVVEDKKDVIVYLMEQSLKNLGRTSDICIQVSEEDYPVVLQKESKLRELVPKDCEFHIERDLQMEKNQCIIIADKQIIDCSLGVQLQGLMEDLKMMM